MQLSEFWDQLSVWSQATFGPDSERGPTGPLKHLAKEIAEVRQSPGDLEEYADLVFLTLDAARRAGAEFENIEPEPPLDCMAELLQIAIELGDEFDRRRYMTMLCQCFGAAFMAGFGYDQLLGAVEAKLIKNRARVWPKPTSDDEPIEHVRE